MKVHIDIYYVFVIHIYILNSVYRLGHYVECMKESAQLLMQKVVKDAKSTASYSTNGEVSLAHDNDKQGIYFITFYLRIMTDARHDSTANTFHSTVACVSRRLHVLIHVTLSVISLGLHHCMFCLSLPLSL